MGELCETPGSNEREQGGEEAVGILQRRVGADRCLGPRSEVVKFAFMRMLTHPDVNGVNYLIVPGKFCLVGQLFLASAIKPRKYPTGIRPKAGRFASPAWRVASVQGTVKQSMLIPGAQNALRHKHGEAVSLADEPVCRMHGAWAVLVQVAMTLPLAAPTKGDAETL